MLRTLDSAGECAGARLAVGTQAQRDGAPACYTTP